MSHLLRYLDVALTRYQLDVEGIHGIPHWIKVAERGLILCESVPGADKEVVVAFAMLHDMERISEDNDRFHGHLAGDYVKQRGKALFPWLSDKQLGDLMFAIYYHSRGETSADDTIGVCWDADRLDLIRLGIQPQDKYLSTEAGKAMALEVTHDT